ncbi:unnamed protein product [Diamesa serratosioi]
MSMPEDVKRFDYGLHQRIRLSRNPSFAGSTSELIPSRTQLMNYGRVLSQQQSIRSNVRSHFHIESENIPPPSTELEKSKMTRRYFATVFAISYAIFLVIFGAIVFVGNAVVDQYPIPEIFCLYMLSVGFMYFIFLYIDIRHHIGKAKHAVKEKERRLKLYEEQLTKVEDSYRSLQIQIPLPNFSMDPIKPISHEYCFATGRHGEFFYLKLGAAWFAFGLLIHSVLTLSYQIIYLTSDDPQATKCSNVLLLVVDIIFPLYSLFVLFFIFKYCNVIINQCRGLARLMLMHAIGTSLAFWIYTIVRETVDAINMKNYYKTRDIMTNLTNTETTMRMNVNDGELFTQACPGPDNLNTIYRHFAPYLYPFIIEFCILIVGIFYMMWANINHCPKKLSAPGHHHDSSHGHNEPPFSTNIDSNMYPSLRTIPEENNKYNNGVIQHNGTLNPEIASVISDHCGNTVDHDNEYKTSSVIYADCHSANRGLFGGMILMILTIVFIILLFVAVQEPDYIDTGILVDKIFELTVLVLLILAVILAYFQTSKLDINHHPMSKLDDVLLFIAIPAFFSETIFSLVPAIVNGSYLNIANIMAQILQVLIQTPWICDALRRCSNSQELRKRKPGRELVTFLTIANVSLWIFYTFSVKNADTKDERYYYYGDVLWSILNHLSLPLIMFYRFHASVCLVDIWRHSYEPGEFAH